MAKKNMDILLGNILGSAVIRPQDKYEKPPVSSFERTPVEAVENSTKSEEKAQEDPWRHFSFICSQELVSKVQAIAHKEGFTIRAFMEYVMKQGIDAYEAKNGKVKKIRTKSINDVM